MKRARAVFLLVNAAALVCCANASRAAQSPTRAPLAARVIAPLLDEAPTIDGDLLEACWQKAAIVAPFLTPEGKSAGAKATAARIMRVGDRLFLGISCADNAPPSTDMLRVKIFLPDGRTRSAVCPSRDAPANSSALRELPGGWTAEMAISLAPDDDEAAGRPWLPPAPGDAWMLRVERLSLNAAAAPEAPDGRICSWPAWAWGEPPAAGTMFFGVANLLPNGDMEKVEKALPAGWRIRANGAPAKSPEEVNVETKYIVEGNYALRVNVKGKATVSLPASKPLRIGARYRLSGRAFLDQTSTGELILPGAVDSSRQDAAENATDAAKAELRTALNPSGQYESVALEFTAGSQHLAPRIELAGKDGICYLDAFSLEMLPNAPDRPGKSAVGAADKAAPAAGENP